MDRLDHMEGQQRRRPQVDIGRRENEGEEQTYKGSQGFLPPILLPSLQYFLSPDFRPTCCVLPTPASCHNRFKQLDSLRDVIGNRG